MEVYKRVLDGNARQSNVTRDQQIQALKDHYKRQDETGRMQLSQLDSIIQQQSEQIKAQQLQTESMNMRMGRRLNTLGPLPIPVVHTATATLPPDTEVKLPAPLSSFASASASKHKDPNRDLWEMIGPDGMLPTFDANDPNTEITGQRSPTLPPTSIAGSINGGGGGGDLPGDDCPDDHASKGSDKPSRGRKDKGGKRHTEGCL